MQGDNDAVTIYDARKMRQIKHHKFQIEVLLLGCHLLLV
jgi:hypothetical protein